VLSLIKLIKKDLYRIQIPLPDTPLKATNNYLILGKERNLWIDTAFNCQVSKDAMDQAIQELKVDMERTDIFITHKHFDHTGLVYHIASPQSRIYCSDVEGEYFTNFNKASNMELHHFLKYQGKEILEDIQRDQQPAMKFERIDNEFHFLSDGDVLRVGNYHLKCLLTPGHTQGHMCLYDEDKKMLFSGDHILGNITPNITLWKPQENVLEDYMNSLLKVKNLDIEMVLPGHRAILTNIHERVDEIIAHHEWRLKEAYSHVTDVPQTAYRIAQALTWDLNVRKWEEFPRAQKTFATGETFSHLYYLVRQGRIKYKMDENNTVLFYRN